jgi:hypothetical protein
VALKKIVTGPGWQRALLLVCCKTRELYTHAVAYSRVERSAEQLLDRRGCRSPSAHTWQDELRG